MENWKDIDGYEGIYQISDLGRVRSLDRYIRVCGNGKRLLKGKIIKSVKCTNGYYEVFLSSNGTRSVFLVHRLVAVAFLSNPNCYEQVNHKDENPQNNCVYNLEWCTPKYNANYGTRNKRMAIPMMKKVKQFNKKHELIKVYESIAAAERETGAKTESIIRVCKGKQKTSLGFIWEYAA